MVSRYNLRKTIHHSLNIVCDNGGGIGGRVDGQEFQDKAKRDDYHFATAGTTAPGRMATNNVVGEYDANGDPKDKGRERQSFTDLIQQITDLQIQLSEQAEYFHKVLEQLMDDRAMALSVRDDLKDFLDDFKTSGDFDMGPDGYPLNPVIRKAIIAHEASSGKTFNPHDADAVTDFIMDTIGDKDDYINGLSLRIEATSGKLDETLTALHSLQAIKDDINAGLYESPDEVGYILKEFDQFSVQESDHAEIDQNIQTRQIDLNIDIPKL